MASWDEYKKTMTQPATLWSAAKDNDVAGLAHLLAAGAELEACDARGYSPLMLAAYHGHEEAFSLLLARGASPDSADAGGNTVLMGAAFKGHLAIVEQLLLAGADITARNHAGLDACDLATTFGRHQVLECLEQTTQQRNIQPPSTRLPVTQQPVTQQQTSPLTQTTTAKEHHQ